MRIGFLGAGGIAGNYLKSLKRLDQPVAAVFDVDADRAAAAAAENGAQTFPDVASLIGKASLDALFVCIPPGAHSDQVAQAARAGIHLFVAKPVALSLEVAENALAAIRDAGVVNQVGYMARYSDAADRVRELLADRRIGMGLGRFHCRMGPSHPWWGKFAVSGGQMVEQTTHVFDMLRYLMGEPTHVHAAGVPGLSAAGIADFEECTVCNLRFEGGSVASVSSTCVAGSTRGFEVELVGDDFSLIYAMGPNRVEGRIDGQQVEFVGQETGYFRQVECFLQAVAAGDPTAVRSDYADATRTLAVTLAANRALRSGAVEAVGAQGESCA